jgi:hypothetical protein
MQRLRKSVALVALVLASGCSGDGGTNPFAPFGGVYALKTVNGAPLPRTVTISGGTIRLDAMHLSIMQDGTYELSGDYTPITYQGPVQNEAFGTYTFVPETKSVSLTNEVGQVWAAGTTVGNTLTLTTVNSIQPSETYVYKR